MPYCRTGQIKILVRGKLGKLYDKYCNLKKEIKKIEAPAPTVTYVDDNIAFDDAGILVISFMLIFQMLFNYESLNHLVNKINLLLFSYFQSDYEDRIQWLKNNVKPNEPEHILFKYCKKPLILELRKHF